MPTSCTVASPIASTAPSKAALASHSPLTERLPFWSVMPVKICSCARGFQRTPAPPACPPCRCRPRPPADRRAEMDCQFLVADGDRDRRFAFRDLLLHLRLARRQHWIVRLDGAREADIGGGVFVAAID